MYMTREIHPDRFAFLEKCEQQRWALEHAQVSERKQPMIEHSYERALTPVETPAQAALRAAELDDLMRKLTPVEPPSFPLTPRELIQKQRGRRYDALRVEGLSQADAGKKVDAETDEEVATWEAEVELAKNAAQNTAYYALKRRLDKQIKDGEINTDEYDAAMRELTEGG
jgi:hypothetical protein